MSVFKPIIPPKHAEHWVYEAFRSISATLGQHAFGMESIIRGEMPDGSGNELIDTSGFFRLPGRDGGQIGYGGRGPGQNLTLSSTIDADKGFIYLGLTANGRVAFDEDNDFFGIGTDTPTARLHLNLATSGTSGNATFGTHFMDATVAQTGYIFSSCAYQNGTGVDWAFVIGGTNPGVGLGSVLFMNQARTVSLRYAYGTYGSDTITYLHQQHGALDTSPPYATVNNNALFVGFNDNCGLYETHHFRHFNVWAEGDNLTGSVLSGRTVTNTNMAIIGFNSPTTQRTSTANYDDQPVMTIGGGYWYASYHGVTLRLTSGDTFAGSGGTEGAVAKQEVFQIKEGGSLNSGSNGMFGVDKFGRLNLYDPGNGSVTSRISGRRSLILLEDGATGATTPNVAFEIQSINAWLDGGTAVAAHRIGIGYDDVQVAQAIRNAIFCGNSRVATSEPSLMNRVAFRTSAFYVTDGTFTYNTGQVGAPLGMMNIFNFVTNSTILLALKRKAGQTGDLTTWYDSDGSTKLAYIDKDGNASFPSVTITSALDVADTMFTIHDDGTVTKKLAWQLSGISAATTRTWTAQDASGTIPLLEFANTWTTTQTMDPATDVNNLLLKSTNQTPGSLTSNALEVRNAAGLGVLFIRNTGRFQIGAVNTTLDGVVRLAISTTPTQSVNLIQCTDGTDTLFSIGARGALVIGANSTALDTMTRVTLNFSSTQSVNVFAAIKAGITVFRMQSSGNVLIGSSATGTDNNGFEKLTVQCSSAETTNMTSWVSGISDTTNLVVNRRAVLSAGRISSAIRFTDDNATPANAKLLALSLTSITAGATRTWTVQDRDGTIALLDDTYTHAYTARTSGPYTILSTDYFIDCTTGTFTVTLPTAIGITGRHYVIKNSGTGVITVACAGAETIDGSTTATLQVRYVSITVVSDGANWKVI